MNASALKTEVTLYGEITIYSPAGEITYRGKPDGYSVETSSVTADGNVLVLLKFAAKKFADFNNLVLLSNSGRVIWRAELPEPSSGDAYTEFELSNHRLLANSWSGHRVKINLLDGKLISRKFVK